MEDTAGVVRLGMPYDQKPESKDLTKFLTDYCKYWRDIGLLLGLKSSVLDLVASAHPMQDRECFRVTLEKWLQLNVEVTWSNLELAITNANRQSLSLQPLTSVPTSQSEVAVMQSHDNQPRQDDERSQVEMNSATSCTSHVSKKTAPIVNPSRAIIEFINIVSRIEEILMINNEVENLKAIKSICKYLPISIDTDKLMFTTEQLEEIDACNKINEIFSKLRFYLRWDDHLILTAIIDRLDSEECEELLGKFESMIDCQMKLEQIFEECEKQEIPKGFEKMVAILNKKYSRITKEEYEQLKGFIAQHCGVESYVMSPFLNMSPSSLLLEWLIPSTAVTHMVENATRNKQIFIKESFLFMKITDIVILENKKEESHKAVQLTNMISKQLNELVASLNPEDREATLSTLRRIFDNIIQHPNDDKYRQINLTSKIFSSKVWQYPAGKKLMKMSGWVLEDNHVRLKDESCVQIVSQILTSLSSSSATGVVPFPDDEFQALIKTICNGDVPCIQKLLKVSHISPNGRICSESGSSFNLLMVATIAQQLEIVKLLLTDYSMDPYVMSMSKDESLPFIEYILLRAPQSFIIAIMKYCGVKSDFKTTNGFSLLHCAVAFKCFDVVCFLLKECSNIDVNAIDDDMNTPLHMAYLCGHTQIAQYLIQHGADKYAVNSDGCTPYEYINGNPVHIKASEYFHNMRKIHHFPYSIEHCYYMKLINIGIDEEEAVSLTMEQFPSLKEDGPTQPHHDIDQASALKEFTQLITRSTQRSTDDYKKQTPSEVQESLSRYQQIVHGNHYLH